MQSDEQGVQAPQQPALCSSGCGFFANIGSNGMCSKCFRELQGQEQKAHAAQEAIARASEPQALPAQPPAAEEPVPASPPAAEASAAAAAAAAGALLPEPQPQAAAAAAAPAEASSSPGDAPAAKAPTRCSTCRKRVGLTGFKCKCGQLFCGQHRYAEAHECSFDYKTTQREKLAAANPVVQAAKVERI